MFCVTVENDKQNSSWRQRGVLLLRMNETGSRMLNMRINYVSIEGCASPASTGLLYFFRTHHSGGLHIEPRVTNRVVNYT